MPCAVHPAFQRRARARARVALGLTFAAALALLALVQAGCYTTRRGDASRLRAAPVLPEASAWPARDVAPLRALRDATPARIQRYVAAPGVDPQRLAPRDRFLVTHPTYTIVHNEIYGVGLLRLFEGDAYLESPPPAAGITLREEASVFRFGFVPNGSVMTSRTLDHPRIAVSRRWSDAQRARIAHELVLTRKPVRMTNDELPSRLLAGVPIRIPSQDEVRSAQARRPVRGLLIHLHSLAPNVFERRLAAGLREHGWIIIDVRTVQQLLPPYSPSTPTTMAQLEAWRDESLSEFLALRPEQVTLDGRLTPEASRAGQYTPGELLALLDSFSRLANRAEVLAAYQACPDVDTAALGAQIALDVDHSLAGTAYAVQTILLYLDAHRPDLAKLPLAILGMSAGALSTPAVAARVQTDWPGRLRAAILVGGGADLFDLSQRSTLTDGGLRLACGESARVLPSVREGVHRAYLASTMLDPLVAARALRGVPVLQVHATLDRWVPASGGDRLARALDGPDRLVTPTGHFVMFATLPTQAGVLARWLENSGAFMGFQAPQSVDSSEN